MGSEMGSPLLRAPQVLNRPPLGIPRSQGPKGRARPDIPADPAQAEAQPKAGRARPREPEAPSGNQTRQTQPDRQDPNPATKPTTRQTATPGGPGTNEAESSDGFQHGGMCMDNDDQGYLPDKLQAYACAHSPPQAFAVEPVAGGSQILHVASGKCVTAVQTSGAAVGLDQGVTIVAAQLKPCVACAHTVPALPTASARAHTVPALSTASARAHTAPAAPRRPVVNVNH